ncbi:MAG: hypothetical protein KAW95_04170, partial [Dehalococcoidia bacterium]|nr:hypothetical protein [Dehalococcoidia bacterium]
AIQSAQQTDGLRELSKTLSRGNLWSTIRGVSAGGRYSRTDARQGPANELPAVGAKHTGQTTEATGKKEES